MRVLTRAALTVAVVVSCAGAVRAEPGGGTLEFQPETVTNRTPLPGPSLIAATSNILYVPFRFAVTTVVGVVGGATGFLLAGDRDAAQDVWGLTDGQSILTQEVMQGKEPLSFGNYEAHLHLAPSME
jgi:hypothetical protein